MRVLYKIVSLKFVASISILVAIGCSAANKKVQANIQVREVSTKEQDYLGDGVVLGRFLWTDFYEAQFYPAKIITPASEETKGEYQLEAIVGSPDIAVGAKVWTKDVILKSHPAKKDELQVGMVVLIGGGENQCSYNELKTAKWRRAVVLSLDNIYKEIIEVRGLYGKSYNIHLSCIRVIDEAPASVLEIPK